ncbi:MAG TPA: ornithine cyclodeaminase family protein [Planctomycetia bacterium]|nr:ornithine cyclodeaminase family protein [Planctomycetia bacterium]
MAAIFLRERDVEQLLPMKAALDAVTTAFEKQAMTEVANIARGRARTDHGMLHVMGAAAKTLGAFCAKIYTSTREGTRFYVHLFDGKSGALAAVIEGDRLGAIRTGATAAAAAGAMARLDAATVGIFGSGKQARTQLEALCHVRKLAEAYVYSRKQEKRERFADEMTALLGFPVRAVARPELAAEDKDIVVAATDSADPVVMAPWISPGTHLSAIGANFAGKAEVDVELVRNCEPIVVDDKEQARIEAGDVIRAVEAGVVRWSDVQELGNVIVGRTPGRHQETDITLFKSVGAAFQDLAVAKVVYDAAVKAGAGEKLPF